MQAHHLQAWFIAFAFTQLVEMPITILAQRRGVVGDAPPPKLTRAALVAFGATAITHPVVWFVFPRLMRPYWTMVACAEAFAVLAEAAWFTWFGMRRAFLWSLIANGASVALGLGSRALFGVP